jgi:hypothetical protein
MMCMIRTDFTFIGVPIYYIMMILISDAFFSWYSGTGNYFVLDLTLIPNQANTFQSQLWMHMPISSNLATKF